MRLAAFPPEAALLPALAQAWLAAPGDPGAGMLILPNRRAARALAGAFLQANAGQALLLPRIVAAQGLDEAGLALAGALDLPPAIEPMRRQAILASLILKLEGENGAPRRLPGAWALAADLAALLDEADYAEIDLAAALPGVVEAELARHWEVTLKFLRIVTQNWPAILKSLRLLNPAARQVALLDAQGAAWAAKPPAEKIWLVAADADPALCRLARVVAGLPAGAVILPGYDPMLPDAAWAALDDSHAQAGIARLLGGLGARREEIAHWPAPASKVPPGRAALLSRALLPAAALADWQQPAALVTAGLHQLAARDEQEDATAIAMILRDALEVPGRSAALVTPDRGLAVRVVAALRRFGVAADDSAGEPLAETPPGVLLRLLARAAQAEFSPLPLLALLKHPLTGLGSSPEITRAQARALERKALRGPRPPPGLAGLRFRLKPDGDRTERDFLARLELTLAPLTGLPLALDPAAALRALIAAAEAIAATADASGAAQLWAGEAGAMLSDTLAEALAALFGLPVMPAADLPDLLDGLLAGQVVRRPRTRDNHPRVAIWGVQEAMLQSVDVAVLGGLVEGVWPAPAEPGPWLSRPMRKAAGLASAERSVGQAAHDFFALACACPSVVLAAPTRRERAPAVPARWLTRLKALLSGAGQALPAHPAAGWAARLDLPAAREVRPKPAPRPPAEARPKRLSISEIATLIADPYAIYARHVLDIRPLDALDEESDQSQFGNIVHAGLATFFSVERNFAAPGAAAELALHLQTALRATRPRPALQHWWEARLERIACWVVEAEAARRNTTPPAALALEQKADHQVAGGFVLRGRADRIEAQADGKVLIMDYKTGAVPEAKKVRAGTMPQLPLEAVMAEAGAFGPAFTGPVTELAYWKLSGRHNPGEDKPLFDGKPAELRKVIDAAAASLPLLFAKFADPATPYLAHPHPDRSTYKDVFAGISRSAEWGGEADDA